MKIGIPLYYIIIKCYNQSKLMSRKYLPLEITKKLLIEDAEQFKATGISPIKQTQMKLRKYFILEYVNQGSIYAVIASFFLYHSKRHINRSVYLIPPAISIVALGYSRYYIKSMNSELKEILKCDDDLLPAYLGFYKRIIV